MSVEVVDKGWNRIVKELALMEKSHVKVGVLQSAGVHPKGETLVDIATNNEFGVPEKRIPSRPFMAIAFDKNLKKLQAFVDTLKDKIFKGESDTRTALKSLGEIHVGQVQEIIGSDELEPNAPMTIALKGSSAPLIDTGRLRQSINYEVE